MPEVARQTVEAADDVRAFEELLMNHAMSGFRLARFFGHSPEDAADVVQEASILAWRYRKTRRGEWQPWFLAIVRRVARRRLSRWALMPFFWRADAGQADPASLGESDLATAMASLPRRQAAAVWLRHGQDLTFRDVGRILGVREGAAKMLVARGLIRLRALLS